MGSVCAGRHEEKYVQEGPSLFDFNYSTNLSGKRILHLTLTKRWFQLIASGEKLEEYREMKFYWETRLEGKEYDEIHFRNGYSSNAPFMRIECKGITIGRPAFKWYGAETTKEVYIIHLGAILELRNYKPTNK